MFQTSDKSQLLRRVLWISAELTIVSSLKHKNTQHLYIFNRVRVIHLDRLKEGTWLHSFEQVQYKQMYVLRVSPDHSIHVETARLSRPMNSQFSKANFMFVLPSSVPLLQWIHAEEIKGLQQDLNLPSLHENHFVMLYFVVKMKLVSNVVHINATVGLNISVIQGFVKKNSYKIISIRHRCLHKNWTSKFLKVGLQ